ncbi:MAG: hypothetical protein AVDCRST_MAG03-3693 [uncultured Rubrobacteraceae bacterium]|uniref:Uncharacterized protein n=1 Tax=uncultured Rubrobacteraceae bacterium TaxID=349277 RepID=A0A6J4Q7R0_9ACTN|nr:MAG: hypothetical protein AVDCRST_MAG03-3693 [uncultured Rubrobacteraceae bacterium]
MAEWRRRRAEEGPTRPAILTARGKLGTSNLSPRREIAHLGDALL